LWRNDPIDYGASWPQQRRLARQRDGFRCQVCGIPEQDREHDVHHRQPFRTFTNPEQANQLSNLITLCPNCHHRAETIVKVRSGLGGLSYLLGHLAPLFLMCDSRDLGVHADPQSSLADGLPAIVIYDLVPAGIGLSKGIYEIHPDLLDSARERILSCPCGEGCPSCVGPGGEQGTGGKTVTLAILEELTRPG
jgi:DEAD/DEAH box helicase domain-containing protein